MLSWIVLCRHNDDVYTRDARAYVWIRKVNIHILVFRICVSEISWLVNRAAMAYISTRCILCSTVPCRTYSLKNVVFMVWLTININNQSNCNPKVRIATKATVPMYDWLTLDGKQNRANDIQTETNNNVVNTLNVFNFLDDDDDDVELKYISFTFEPHKFPIAKLLLHCHQVSSTTPM